MIEALYEIGKIQEAGDLLDEFIEDIGSGYKHVFKIVFDITAPANFAYKKIGYEEFDKGRKLKYLYKKGSPNGPDCTPTSKIINLSKTFNKKIFKSIRTFIKYNGEVLDERGRLFLGNLDKCLNARKDDILKDLISLAGQSMQVLKENDTINEGGVLTMAFVDAGQMLYLGDLEIFKNAFCHQETDA
ncbi:MAG TPA: TM1802 family CRISPR-associated protein, partial [Candidatus Kapabacteria bacterium]|nr:TM1802 family CRISPR-associated protein [Candidatus Kapabacteria bacterium]